MATARGKPMRAPAAPTSRRRTTAAAARPRARKKGERPDPKDIKNKVQSLPKKPWNVDVDVYLEPPGSDPPFTLETCLQKTSSGRIMFRNRRRPGFIIRFRLHDELNPGYLFMSDPTEAIWSKKGPATACPQTGVWQVFMPYAVEDGRMTLVVYNENPHPAVGNFQFSLRVTRDDGSPPLLLDPGGGDQNGPDR